MECEKCKSKESDKKSLKNILEEGAQWQNDLSMIIIDLCLKIEKLEKCNKLD